MTTTKRLVIIVSITVGFFGLAIIGIIAVDFFEAGGIRLLFPVTDTLTFSDSTFNNVDWKLDMVVQSDGGIVAAEQLSTGGNPGNYRYISTTVNAINDYTFVRSLHIKTNAIYNPQSLGPITTIDYSEDAIGGEQGQATGLALRQNGQLYFSLKSLSTPKNRWRNKKLKNLKEKDFINVENKPTNTPNHPDFSASATPIEFGFYRANSGSASYSIGSGIDNWKVTVNYNDLKSVPEPSSL